MPEAETKRALRVLPRWMRSRSWARVRVRPKVWNQMTKVQPSRQREQPQPREPVMSRPCPQRGQPRPVELGSAAAATEGGGGGGGAGGAARRAGEGMDEDEGEEEDEVEGDDDDDDDEVRREMAAARSLEIEGSSERRAKGAGRGAVADVDSAASDSSKGRSSSRELRRAGEAEERRPAFLALRERSGVRRVRPFLALPVEPVRLPRESESDGSSAS